MSVVYCVIPPAGAEALPDVRAFYAGFRRPVEVIVERRLAQRRRLTEEEQTAAEAPDRRGAADRRRFVVPRELEALPDALAARTGPVRWVQHLLPVGPATEQLSPEDVIAAVRAGDAEAPTELYWRCYERMRSALAVQLSDAREVDAAVVRALGRVLDALEDDERTDARFEDLLYEQIERCAEEVRARRAGLHAVPDGGLEVTGAGADEPVEIHDALAAWTRIAATDREDLFAALGDHVIAVEHVGSTAVPGVAARETLDFVVGLHGLPPTPAVIAVLEQAGFEHRGAAGVEGRVFFRRRSGHPADLHLLEYGGALWNDTVGLRDFMRKNPAEGQRWAEVKRYAARTSPESSVRYFDLRRLTLDEMLTRARARARHGAPAA